MYAIASVYAFLLFLIAFIPFLRIHRHFVALLGGVLMFFLIDLSLGLIPWSDQGARSFSMILFFASIEEMARGTSLYLFVSRSGNSTVARAILGGTYGWMEFSERVLPNVDFVRDALGQSQLTDLMPYMLIAWACAILGHILYSVTIYRHATDIVTMIKAVIVAAIVHATYNYLPGAFPWSDHLKFRLAMVPSFMIALLMLWSYLALWSHSSDRFTVKLRTLIVRQGWFDCRYSWKISLRNIAFVLWRHQRT